MNAVFNLKRFVYLAKREVIYSWKVFLYLIAGFIVYFILAQLLDNIWDTNLLNVIPIAALAIMICGTSLVDKNLSKTNAKSFFTIPVSNFERWLILWLKAIIVMPVLLVSVVYLLDAITPIQSLKYVVDINYLTERIQFLLAFQSVFFLGYIYFRKRSLVKAGIAFAILIILIHLISKLVISQLYPEVYATKESFNLMYILAFDGFYNWNTHSYTAITTSAIYDICLWIIKLIFPFGLWFVSYIRLRETEI